jgi:hypothetical protein
MNAFRALCEIVWNCNIEQAAAVVEKGFFDIIDANVQLAVHIPGSFVRAVKILSFHARAGMLEGWLQRMATDEIIAQLPETRESRKSNRYIVYEAHALIQCLPGQNED